jgi:hypothetical protein
MPSGASFWSHRLSADSDKHRIRQAKGNHRGHPDKPADRCSADGFAIQSLVDRGANLLAWTIAGPYFSNGMFFLPDLAENCFSTSLLTDA